MAGDEQAMEPDDATTTDPTAGATSLPATPAPAVPSLPMSLDGVSPMLLLSLVLPLVIALYFLFGKKSGGRGGRSLLLFGPVGAGKTALYHQLKHGRVVPTVSSMEPASGSFALRAPNGSEPAPPTGAPIHVCDMPGTGRLRVRLRDEAAGASALVCMLDGTQLAAQAREAAGMLFDMYSHETVGRRPPPLLVAVNKLDLAGCATPVSTHPWTSVCMCALG